METPDCNSLQQLMRVPKKRPQVLITLDLCLESKVLCLTSNMAATRYEQLIESFFRSNM